MRWRNLLKVQDPKIYTIMYIESVGFGVESAAFFMFKLFSREIRCFLGLDRVGMISVFYYKYYHTLCVLHQPVKTTVSIIIYCIVDSYEGKEGGTLHNSNK